LRDSGNSRVGELERWDPIDCTIVKVIALRGGPVAVGTDGEMVSPTGEISTAGIASVSVGSSGWMSKIIWALIGLTGAAVAMVRAKPQAAAQVAGPRAAGALTTVNTNLDYIGLALVVVGVVWLLAGWIVYELLPAVGLVACGLYVASDFLRSRGLLKDAQYAQLKAFGPMIAIATAFVSVLHLFVGHWILF